MITEEERFYLKERFIELLRSIKREGARIEDLIRKLENSDFFVAPASTQYHGSYKGGLLEHCMNVYDNLRGLVSSKSLGNEISDESIIVVSLLHDISKMNYYEEYSKNVKVYSDSGKKVDELGKFDWKAELSYRIRENRFLYGSHEQTAEFIARQFIPLTIEESVAILNHMGGLSFDSTKLELAPYYNEYPLLTLLHVADMIATYVDERQ